MSDLAARIQALPPRTAVSLLNAVTRAQVNRGGAVAVDPDAALADDLATAAGITPDADATDGDVATAALLLLADDPAMHHPLEHFLDHPPAVPFADPVTLGVGLAALVVLQSYVKFERDKAGKWTFKFEKQPMSDSLLKAVIAKLGGWLTGAGK